MANLSFMDSQKDLVKRLETLEASGAARRTFTHAQDKAAEEMQTELAVLRAKMADAQVMIKQAQQQQDEYMRLADRYNELERKYENRSEEKAKSK
jgi:predicted nuclease with TOPRIM domain